MIQFNTLGYLEPDTSILVTKEQFYEIFVTQFTSIERVQLYDSYVRYSTDLKELCQNVPLRQWIDGSFVTKTALRPNDIDMVTFISETMINELGNKLNPFKYPFSQHNYPGIDGYLVCTYDKNSKFHHLTKSDELHWHSIFNKTRRNRNGIKIPKGFLEIMY
ncbi:MAG: hypothetical protein IT221_16805 [Fluviicola sp.]|nr:hypothetical protein [Fluviicola sp.]